MSKNYLNSEIKNNIFLKYSRVIRLLFVNFMCTNNSIKLLFILFFHITAFASNTKNDFSISFSEGSGFHKQNNAYGDSFKSLTDYWYRATAIDPPCPTSAGTLSGIQYMCTYGAAMTTTFSSSVSGGVWSSSNVAIAKVDANTGVVTSVTAVTCMITYTVATTGCTTQTATRTVFVSSGAGLGPVSISGSNSQCKGSTATYTIVPDPYSYSYQWVYDGGGSGAIITTAPDQLSASIYFSPTATPGNVTVTSIQVVVGVVVVKIFM